MKLLPGVAVVLEGLDRAGKSTQRAALETIDWADPKPLFTHMPSGLTEVTRETYKTLEQHKVSSPLARQLFHLACHAENLRSLVETRRERAIVLDRWWWSTVAYGWYGGLGDRVDKASFLSAVEMVWGGFRADVVFVFLAPYAHDDRNSVQIAAGYEFLQGSTAISVLVPQAEPKRVTDFLLSELKRRRLAVD